MTMILKAKDFMVRELITTHPETDAYEAIGLLLKHRISGMPVVDDGGKLVGILSERDCLKTLLDAQYHELPTALVQDLMSTELETIDPETDLLEIADLFLNRRFRRLPVIEHDQLVGQISRRDVLRAIQHLH